MTTITTEQEASGIYIAQFKTSDIALFSYYIESQKQAYLIDPTFDTGVYKDVLSKRGAALKYVILTHYHADFLSGHTSFGVPIIMGPTAKHEISKFDITELKDGESFKLGSIQTVCYHTPGHTMESSCFVLKDSEGKDICLFSGDTVFLGDIGRPDLAVSSNIKKEDLAGYLYDSIQKLKKFNGEMRLYPGHGSGSACGKSIGAGNFCTLGKQFEANYGFTTSNKEQFVTKLITGIAPPPAYFFHDAKLNHIGPGNFDQQIKKCLIPLGIEEFQKASANSTVFQTRGEVEGGIIKGSYWVPEKGAITNWVTMISSPQDPITIIADEGKAEMIIGRLIRIGYFNIQGYNNFKVSAYPGEKFNPKIYNGKQSLELQNRQHLDVRNRPEWESTGVIENSILIPLGQLKNRTGELKDKKNLIVSCRTGMRARFAYSIMANAGIESVVLSDGKVQINLVVTELEGMGHKFVKPQI